MSEKPTIKQLKEDEGLLRRTIGKVLADRNDSCQLWVEFGGTLASCPHGRSIEFRDDGIPYHADAYVGPLEVAAERLLKAALERGDTKSMGGGYIGITIAIEYMSGLKEVNDQFPYWLMLNPKERIICCLLALGAAEIGDQK